MHSGDKLKLNLSSYAIEINKCVCKRRESWHAWCSQPLSHGSPQGQYNVFDANWGDDGKICYAFLCEDDVCTIFYIIIIGAISREKMMMI